MSGVLLDTCALIWIAEGEPLDAGARQALDDAWRQGHDIAASPISAWEIGLLAARGRLTLTLPAERWWGEAMERLGLTLAPMDPSMLIASSWLPGQLHPDPADRILIATARAQGLRLMTRDRKILSYAAAGNLNAVAC